MKKAKLIFVLFLGCFYGLTAQVSEQERSMTQGTNNALIITIPGADDGEVEKLWKKYMKSYDAKPRKIKKSEEWLAGNAEISGVGGASDVDVYATFEQSGDDVILTAWFDLGATYLNSAEHSERYSAGEKFLMGFETEVYKEGVRLEIKLEENNLKKIESNLKKLEKEKTRYEREIEQAKERIAKAEANIETNLIEQEEAHEKIKTQLETVAKTKKKLEIRED